LKFKRAENQDRVIDVKNKNDEQEQVAKAPALLLLKMNKAKSWNSSVKKGRIPC
jgi:hypothetical protein